jgi:hypothetical protein
MQQLKLSFAAALMLVLLPVAAAQNTAAKYLPVCAECPKRSAGMGVIAGNRTDPQFVLPQASPAPPRFRFTVQP